MKAYKIFIGGFNSTCVGTDAIIKNKRKKKSMKNVNEVLFLLQRVHAPKAKKFVTCLPSHTKNIKIKNACVQKVCLYSDILAVCFKRLFFSCAT